MLVATTMPRVFMFKENGQDLKLDDPNKNWTADQVLNHYTPLYPILANATVKKPVTRDDRVIIEFATTIGTKG